MSLKDNMSRIAAPAGVMLYMQYRRGNLKKLGESIFHKGSTITDAAVSADAFTGEPRQIYTRNGEFGDSAQNIEFDPNVYQYYDDTCAIRSQQLVLERYGINVSQEELIAISKENGWYVEGYGSRGDMIGNLLEYYGIPATTTMDNNLFDLASELSKGHQVIASVDGLELVHPTLGKIQDWLSGEAANHALCVVGLDTSDPDNVQVIVTDPGMGHRAMAYPAKQFLNAWNDSHCMMISTDIPTPQFQTPTNFGGLSLPSIEQFASHSHTGIDTNDLWVASMDKYISGEIPSPEEVEDFNHYSDGSSDIGDDLSFDNDNLLNF